MTAAFFGRFVFAFVFTQVVEVPIYRRGLGVSIPRAFGASAITHPAVWFVFPSVWAALYQRFLGYAGPAFALGPTAQHWGYGVLAEGFAVAVEAAYFYDFGVKKALRWSLIANATSALIGLLSSELFGLP